MSTNFLSLAMGASVFLIAFEFDFQKFSPSTFNWNFLCYSLNLYIFFFGTTLLILSTFLFWFFHGLIFWLSDLIKIIIIYISILLYFIWFSKYYVNLQIHVITSWSNKSYEEKNSSYVARFEYPCYVYVSYYILRSKISKLGKR